MGQVIAGRFELGSHIASGGSGSIWTAWDRRREAWCAAKVLRHKDSGELLRFVREQGIQLDHRHLATPYGWAAEDEDVAISMPLVAGGTLDTALNDHGALSSPLAAALLLQLLDALAHVHSAGWIHRDVKPANILLEPTGDALPHLRLGDFGIAVREDDPRFTMAGWVNGTPGYLAPEAMDLAAPAPEQDLYAAGVVALRMLDPTLKGERGLEAAVLNPRRTLDAIDGVDPRLAAVVAELLDEDPQDRLSAAGRAAGTLDVLARPQTRAGGYLAASGEPFTVFRLVDPDPEVEVDSEAEPSGADDPARAPSAPSAHSVPAPPGRTPSVGRAAGPLTGPGPRSAPPEQRRRGSILPWVLVLAGAVALAVAAVLLWPWGGAADHAGAGDTAAPASDPASPPASAPDRPASHRPTAASAPQSPTLSAPTASPTAESSSPSSTERATAPTPSGGTPSGPPITSSVEAGDACTVLERGMVVTGADGRELTCLEDGAERTWIAGD